MAFVKTPLILGAARKMGIALADSQSSSATFRTGRDQEHDDVIPAKVRATNEGRKGF
jgi:hypothetical protein